MYQHHKAWTGIDFGDKLPSGVFLERDVATCAIDDAFGIENHAAQPRLGDLGV